MGRGAVLKPQGAERGSAVSPCIGWLVCVCLTAHTHKHTFTFSVFFPSADKKLLILSRPSGPDGASDATRWPLLTEEGRAGENGGAGPATGTPDYTSQGKGGSSNIVIYVSVLAAVVLGLLLYVAYKW